MIKLTESAKSKISNLIDNNGEKGVRVGVIGGGCSGFKYHMKFESQQLEADKTFKFDNFEVFVDKKSYLYLMGVEIDYVENLNEAGFKFLNPGAKRTCGCGESFSV